MNIIKNIKKITYNMYSLVFILYISAFFTGSFQLVLSSHRCDESSNHECCHSSMTTENEPSEIALEVSNCCKKENNINVSTEFLNSYSHQISCNCFRSDINKVDPTILNEPTCSKIQLQQIFISEFLENNLQQTNISYFHSMLPFAKQPRYITKSSLLI